MVALQILVLFVGVRILPGEIAFTVLSPVESSLWSLRLSVRTKDSQSLKTGSIPVGTGSAARKRRFFIVHCCLYYTYR